MGTSTSHRSPRRTRWAAFVAAAVGKQPPDRIRSELFNAGDEWEQALSSAAVSSYATTVARLFESLAHDVDTGSPTTALATALRDARDAAGKETFSPALPVADRAFHRLILELVPVSRGPGDAQREFIEARGPSPTDLVARFSAEVFAEYARHAVDREAGRLVQADQRLTASAELSRTLADLASGIGRAAAAAELSESEPVGESWPRVVSRGFARGRVLPHSTNG